MKSFVSRDSRDVGWLIENIPCRTACPANTDIPGYIEAIARKEYSLSYEINRRDNIFPGILGRVCTRPCEPPCRHGFEGLGEPVSICHLKRAAWDFGRFDVSEKWEKAPPTGKKVAVVGAGPSGLACANELLLWGHRVTVFEKHDAPGGMMILGIPRFRLPEEVTRFDIESVLKLGVELRTGVTLGKDVTVDELSAKFDAVVIATGTMSAIRLGIPGEEGEGVHHGLNFMMDVNMGVVKNVPERVTIVGGGFTAVDCARSAVRLGAKKVVLVYRRTQAEMNIDFEELEEMEAEGIETIYLASPVEVIRGGNGEVRGVKFVRNRLGEPDESGRRKPVPVPGSEFVIETDLFIPAVGQRAELDPLGEKVSGNVIGMDNLPGTNVFFAGDVRTGPSSIIEAVADGKRVADRVHTFLTGEGNLRLAVRITPIKGPGTGRERSYDFIEKQHMPTLPLKDRYSMEAEVLLGFDEETAGQEAKRCYLCDHDYQIHIDRCIYCSACIEAMPRKCILMARKVDFDDQGRMSVEEASNWDEVAAIVIDNVECIRCGNCVRACPVDCISVARIQPFRERGR